MADPLSSVALLALLASGLASLGFVVIRLAPVQPPVRIFAAFYRFRRGVLATALAIGVAAFLWAGFPAEGWILIGLQGLFLLIDLVVDEARIFRTVEVADFEPDASRSTLDGKAPVVILEVGGDARAYPLTYVAHHEVINDTVGGKRVVVSFCNQCNSVMAYDATDPARTKGFAVAAIYRGNLVMKDLDTHTLWQQASGESLAGSLHPCRLPPLFSCLLPWNEARGLFPEVKLARTNAKERLPFKLRFFPWERLQRSNYIMGLRKRDVRLPARTPVIGVERIGGNLAYLKDEVAAREWVRNDDVHLLLVMAGGCASGFLTEVDGVARRLTAQGGRISDLETGSVWDLRGHGLAGPLKGRALVAWPIHDGFWFAWSDRHPLTSIVRVEGEGRGGSSTPSAASMVVETTRKPSSVN